MKSTTPRLEAASPASPSPGSDGHDREVLSALDAKDYKRALRLAMAAYGDSVYGYCSRVLGEQSLVDDVHQLVFIQAYEAFPSFARRSTLRTWLFGIANHRCLDALKSFRRAKKRLVSDEGIAETPAEGMSVEGSIDKAIVAHALDDCLAGLLPPVRMALLLHFHEGFTFEEMSAMLREKAGTLQARVSRAMPFLRDCLRTKGIGREQA